MSSEEWGLHIARVTREAQVKSWRAVEAQHVIVTARLVDNEPEQALLESLFGEAKPPVPAAATGLHWLLFTPFRYPPLPRGSRFRSAGESGVWYGADERSTACAELGYWRWRFLCASPALDALPAQPQTLFQTQVRGRAIDLRRGRFAEKAARWTDPNDYAHCQALARAARQRGVSLIRYQSVRDLRKGACTAVLDWRAFERKQPLASETWLLEVTRERAVWVAADPLARERFEYAATFWNI